jgi:hypothetical protein
VIAASSLVLLDINCPNFLESLFVLDKNDKIQQFNQPEKISKLTWADVQRDSGLKWEKIHPIPVALQRHLQDDKQRTLKASVSLRPNVRLFCARGTTCGFWRCRKITDSTYV